MKYLTLRRFILSFYNEWRQIFQVGQCNWYMFTLINIYFEIDTMSRGLELELTLLGLHFTIRYDYGSEHSEMKQRADEAYAEIMSLKQEGEEQGEAS